MANVIDVVQALREYTLKKNITSNDRYLIDMTIDLIENINEENKLLNDKLTKSIEDTRKKRKVPIVLPCNECELNDECERRNKCIKWTVWFNEAWRCIQKQGGIK